MISCFFFLIFFIACIKGILYFRSNFFKNFVPAESFISSKKWSKYQCKHAKFLGSHASHTSSHTVHVITYIITHIITYITYITYTITYIITHIIAYITYIHHIHHRIHHIHHHMHHASYINTYTSYASLFQNSADVFGGEMRRFEIQWSATHDRELLELINRKKSWKFIHQNFPGRTMVAVKARARFLKQNPTVRLLFFRMLFFLLRCGQASINLQASMHSLAVKNLKRWCLTRTGVCGI